MSEVQPINTQLERRIKYGLNVALAVALIRRGRELFWISLGLLIGWAFSLRKRALGRLPTAGPVQAPCGAADVGADQAQDDHPDSPAARLSRSRR